MENRLPAKNFQELLVWQKVHALVLSLYKFSAGFPNGNGSTNKHHEMLDEVGRMPDTYSASILTSVS